MFVTLVAVVAKSSGSCRRNRSAHVCQVLSRFGKAAAEEAMRRIDEFSWQDLQGSAQH